MKPRKAYLVVVLVAPLLQPELSPLVLLLRFITTIIFTTIMATTFPSVLVVLLHLSSLHYNALSTVGLKPACQLTCLPSAPSLTAQTQNALMNT